MADVGVADEGAGLDLLDHRPPGGAGHQEEQAGVGEGHRGLGEQLGRGSVLAVGVGDVQPHAAGAGGAHLEVEAGARLASARSRMSTWRTSCGIDRERISVSTSWATGPGATSRPARRLVEVALREHCRGVDVLVGDGGGGVDRVDHHVGAVTWR